MKSVNALLLATIFMASGVFAANLDKIDPVGDENLGNLVVTSPIVSKSVGMPEIIVSGFTDLSQPARLTEGDHVVTLIAREPLFRNSINLGQKTVSIIKKQTTTFSLGALELTINPEILQVDVGPTATLSFVSKNSNVNFEFEKWLYGWPTDIKTIPLFSDTYTIGSELLPILAPTQFNIKEGQILTKTIAIPEFRATVNILAPTDVEFPDAVSASNYNYGTYLVQRSQKIAVPRDVRAPITVVQTGGQNITDGLIELADSAVVSANNNSTLRCFAAIETGKPLIYELVVNNTVRDLVLTAGQTLDVQLKRLDVNDVLVTKEDGTKEYVRGSYTIATDSVDRNNNPYWQPLIVPNYINGPDYPQGQTSFPTKTGITLLPGKYKVLVNYTTKEGPKTDEHIVTLR